MRAQNQTVTGEGKAPRKRYTAKQIQRQIAKHKYVERDVSPIIKCPECGKLVATSFPIHDCKPKKD